MGSDWSCGPEKGYIISKNQLTQKGDSRTSNPANLASALMPRRGGKTDIFLSSYKHRNVHMHHLNPHENSLRWESPPCFQRSRLRVTEVKKRVQYNLRSKKSIKICLTPQPVARALLPGRLSPVASHISLLFFFHSCYRTCYCRIYSCVLLFSVCLPRV